MKSAAMAALSASHSGLSFKNSDSGSFATSPPALPPMACASQVPSLHFHCGSVAQSGVRLKGSPIQLYVQSKAVPECDSFVLLSRALTVADTPELCGGKPYTQLVHSFCSKLQSGRQRLAVWPRGAPSGIQISLLSRGRRCCR